MELHRSFIDRLLRAVPEMMDIYSEHLEDNCELLTHVLMGDVTRWYIKQCVEPASNTGAAASAKRLANALDSEYARNEIDPAGETVRNFLRASFVENLWQAEEHLGLVVNNLGPLLRQEADRQYPGAVLRRHTQN